MRVGYLALPLLLSLPANLPAQEAPLREVGPGTLTSRSDPAAVFKIDSAFHYVGSQTIDILGVAGAEQYFFMDTAADHSIRRFYWIQFEHYYPSNTATYDYTRTALRPVKLGSIPFMGDIRTIPQYFTDDNRPGSDSKAAEDFLVAHGLALDGTFVTLRLFNLPDSTKRRELMVIYGERLPDGASDERARATITAHAQANIGVSAYPAADAHQHLLSPAIAQLLGVPAASASGPDARDLIALLDSAHIQRAVLLSVAYMYGSPSRTVVDEYAKVRAENDWTAAQAARYPERLVALCSFNPLKPYALEEVDRCAADPRLRRGIKLHFGNSDVQLDAPEHVRQLQRVFQAANAHGMAIVVHLRASIDRQRPYGLAEAHIFLEHVLPFAPDVPVQVAHFAGAGPGYHDPPADSVMAVLAEAVARHDPATAHLWFDVASLADLTISSQQAALLVQRIRQVGVERVLYGSDAAFGNNLRPREGWQAFCRLPLSDQELTTIAGNRPPYLQ